MAHRLFIAAFCLLLIEHQTGQPTEAKLYDLQKDGKDHKPTVLIEERSKRYTCIKSGGKCKNRTTCGVRDPAPGKCPPNRVCCAFP
uniref:Putative tick defensin n=1 Tax=Rhipicephalus pulchellus TaxID=72859 RepID=L7MA24_RHIPC